MHQTLEFFCPFHTSQGIFWRCLECRTIINIPTLFEFRQHLLKHPNINYFDSSERKVQYHLLRIQTLENQINTLETFEEFKRYHSSSPDLTEIRQIHILTLKQCGDIIGWCNRNCPQLKIYEKRYILDFWVKFFFNLVDKCLGADGSSVVRENIQNQFRVEIYSMLRFALPVIRGLVLYQDRKSWFHREHILSEGLKDPGPPTIDDRILVLVDLLELRDDPDIQSYLVISHPTRLNNINNEEADDLM